MAFDLRWAQTRGPMSVLRWTQVFAWTLCALGCGNSTSAQSKTYDPSVIGAQSAPRLKDGGLSAATFSVFVAARNAQSAYGAPAVEDFDVRCSAGPCAIVRARWVPGSKEGVLAIVVDDSGSNSLDATVCTGCPTDPEGKRKVAVKNLVRVLLERAPKWRVALFDFGPVYIDSFRSTRLIAGYTSRVEDLEAGADLLKSGGGTYLYDALYAVPGTAAGEQRFSFPDGGVPVRLLVVSDGEDTHSTFTLNQGLDAGISLGVSFDAVGYGQVDGGSTPYLAARAYNDLRSCSSSTGGLVTLVSRDKLPTLFEQLAEIYVAGYVELVVELPAGMTSVSGSVGLKGSSTRAEFDFQ
jgi:hypothetical protein